MGNAELRVFGGGLGDQGDDWKQKRARAIELKEAVETSYVELARILWEVFDTPADGKNGPPIYTNWGYKTFTSYIEVELGIQGRKGEHLKNIWHKLAVENGGLHLTLKLEERLIRLGWSKVRELVSVLTSKTAETWIQEAERCSYTELVAKVAKAREEIRAAAARAEEAGEDPTEAKQAAKDTVTPLPVRSVSKHFHFYDDQWDNVGLAIEKARTIANARSDKKNEGYLLDLICTEFLGTNNFGEQPTSAKVAILHKMSNLMGLKLAIIDPGAPVGEKIVYGVQHLEELQKDTTEAVGNADESEDEGDEGDEGDGDGVVTVLPGETIF